MLVILAICTLPVLAFANATPAVTSAPQNVTLPQKGIIVVPVKVGQHFKKGDLLFSLNPAEYEAQKIIAEANMLGAMETFKIDRKLVATKSISIDTYQNALSQYRADAMKYQTAVEDVKQCFFYAPYDGTVMSITYYTGSGYGDGYTAMTIQEGNLTVPSAPIVAQVDNRFEGIVNLYVKLGEKVKAGQPLFSCNSQLNDIQLHTDEAALVYSKEVFERDKVLLSSHTIPYSQYITDKYTYTADLATVMYDKIEIANSVSCAPFDGTVTAIGYAQGSGPGAGDNIVTITQS